MGTTASAIKSDLPSDAESESDLPPLESPQAMAAFAKNVLDAPTLEALARHAAAVGANLFHYAAAVGDREFFSIMMTFLPLPAFAKEMRRCNTNGMKPIDCCEHIHPALATALKTFFIERGVNLDKAPNARSAQIPNAAVKLEAVVGMEQARARIMQAFRLAETNPELPIKPLLLEGPPGTGKSFLATCIAAELGRDVVEIKCQDVLSHRLGGNEAQIRAYFEQAARMEPTKGVVVINEFESLCPRQKESSESWHATLRQCFLTLFDAIIDPTSRYWGVYVVLTTNYADNIDSAAKSRMESIHVPLPSSDNIKLLFPKLCHERVPSLDIQRVNWEVVASIAHQQLSVRGIQDAIASVARKCLATNDSEAAATTSDFEAAVYELIGNVTLEPLKRADKFIRVSIPPKLAQNGNSSTVSLASCLARCGWRFSSAPNAVFRQVFALSEIDTDAHLMLREAQTEKVFSGRGCYRALIDPPRDPAGWKPFDKYEVYVQCVSADGDRPVPPETTTVFLESYGNSGVQKLEWKANSPNVALYAGAASSTSLSACLAPHLKPFVVGRVFVESKSASALEYVNQTTMLVLNTDDGSYLTSRDAMLIGGGAAPAILTNLGYQVFFAATSAAQLVPQHACVIYLSPVEETQNPTLKRLVVAPNKFVVCPNTATTIGATLRVNSIFYAALEAIYVRQIEFDDIRSLHEHQHKLLAIPVDGPTFAWSGPAIADYAREASFRAKYHVYISCTGPNQMLPPGSSVMLDLEVISQPLSSDKKFAILRHYPSPGLLNLDTQTHHGACVSDSGAQVRDKGYRDDDFLTGFRKGWYDDIYWRTVGDHPGRFLSGGVDGNNYKFNVHEEHDFGYEGKRIMIKLPTDGIVFCRGVRGVRGDDPANPVMACVLFHADGQVRDKYGYEGLLGRWNDIVQ